MDFEQGYLYQKWHSFDFLDFFLIDRICVSTWLNTKKTNTNVKHGIISLQKNPILHILADSLDGNRKKTYPYPTKNHQNCKNYTFQFLSKPQRIETGQILTVFVLLVVGKRILSRFGDRKSVFVVRNYEKWWFWGIFDFPKNWRSKDNAKQIMQFE